MSTQYPVLGSPLQVNGITLKNRMITTSMSPGAGYVTKDNRPTQRLANYLEERAEGQTALIIQTICPWKRNEIDPDHIHELPSCYDESCIPDLQRYMIEPVHKHGGLICAQPYYVHDWKPDAETPEGPYGPSDIAILKFMGGFRAMTLEQIEAFKQQYFNAARVCKEAGFDAIEVMAGVGGILSRFMALATNNRTDEYGGSLENRVKLTLEVIRGVREVVGPKFPIVVRWSPIDFIRAPQVRACPWRMRCASPPCWRKRAATCTTFPWAGTRPASRSPRRSSRTATGRSSRSRSRPWRRNRWRRGIATPIRA